ncbi:hypothetical protein L198_01402 [Cryptococcus wingfieldii CBS 7118]|uniref:Uncharacterized protein n=1 Tax=Cryptococcus wingfieldii CBS 7118 TaxID=1295528 RepID=A0A1E3JZ89_9TREE|nr:hypothetical protein L198_01402 [Cryptococcus wingfieldii CBS 7118]ODO06170.1 hypothetical protein L198_01402 [Cryptococcus wingfieldii CBS 7118]
MSAKSVKLSPAIKALLSAPHAQGGPIPAPPRATINSLFDRIRTRGEAGGVGAPTWLTVSTGALVTTNSPDSVRALWDYASERSGGLGEKVEAAGVIRETALKCISFSGIPRTINALTSLRAHLPEDVINELSTTPTRQVLCQCYRVSDSPCRKLTPQNVTETLARGQSLWDAIYEPLSAKLLSKLSDAHPDLPVHILTSHYSHLLSDPFTTPPPGGAKVGRVLTSVVSMACLRAQQGVGPQLTSHVFGLKKSLLEGGGAEREAPLKGQEWLTSDEGVRWVLESTDEISQVLTEGRASFAGPVKAKL